MTTLFGRISNTINNVLPLFGIGERAADPVEAMRRNNDALSANIRVAVPAKVVSFNASEQTIVAQPLIREKIINRFNGDVNWLTIPVIPDVPVCFPQAGNFVLTMPIAAGDEVLLVFNDSCIDSWWANGGLQNWNDKRRHDLSDAVAVIGLNSLPNKISSIASNATELRSKSGTTKVRVESSQVSMTAGGNNVTVGTTGVSITGILTINGRPYLTHQHTGVQSGGSVSGPVAP